MESRGLPRMPQQRPSTPQQAAEALDRARAHLTARNLEEARERAEQAVLHLDRLLLMNPEDLRESLREWSSQSHGRPLMSALDAAQ